MPGRKDGAYGLRGRDLEFPKFASYSLHHSKSHICHLKALKMSNMRFRALNTTLKAVILEASKNTKVLIFQY